MQSALDSELSRRSFIKAALIAGGGMAAMGPAAFGAKARIYLSETVPESFADRLRAGLGLEVEHDAALVAAQAHAECTHPGVPHGLVVAQHVAVGRFDPDDVGAHVGEHARRQRPHHDCRQVYDTYAF